jgi:proton-translocating NADH-quinone oxidoreductase chain L
MGWEGVGLCSYLLISFWYTRISAGKAAMKAIVLNRIGDCGLLLAIFAIFLTFRTLEFSVIFAVTPFFEQKTFMFLNYEFRLLNFIAFFLLIAAIGKSAQIGLHTWLPDAMEGPTPVSALIHAATMVTAGVFLIIRCSPIFEYTPGVLLTMTIVGSLTSIFAASAAIVQHDIKKTVAYSTCSQLGYMVFCCGLSNYPVSLYHLVTHAFFKALLFLSAGAVIHALLNEQDIRKMGGLAKLLPFSFVMMLIGSLALSGFPFLAGFYSKDLILETTIQTSNYFQYFVIYTSFLTALLTAIYSFRTLYIVFLAPTSVYKTTSKQIHEVPPIMAFSLLVLAVGSIFSGYFFFDMFVGLGSDFFENSVFIHDINANTWISIEYLNPFFKQVAPFLGIIGIFIAISLLKNHSVFLTIYKSVYNYYLYKFLTNK